MPEFEPAPGTFLRVLADHWHEVLALVGPGTAQAVTALLARGGESDDPFDVLASVAYRLLPELPAAHALQRTLNSGFRYAEETGPDVTESEREARASLVWFASTVLASGPLTPPGPRPDRAAGHDPGPPPEPSEPVVLTGLPTWQELHAAVRRRLLALPGAPGGGPGLIRLPSPTGALVPAFQFGPGDEPWPIVLEVNRMLDAQHDPWGVAGWWVDPHAWLSAPPADLLGTGGDDRLRLAARSLVED